ncbi:hypothetical protein GCM10010124_05980 [Pilimelia terevasa]|uniref:DUF4360 domain-containing protein n=1 Tax=Pilimelia terevasa TaxID=53372 RepID=A0A8J3FGB8_9ACTN|nr:DUF4360 domain-containing protein [Pilimelia terevasa]GGK16164.1 hypothetical protein GCM10010124_05980 [Pilimelia terevasa]
MGDTMKHAIVVAAATAAVLAGTALPATAVRVTPRDPDVKISNVRLDGTGCSKKETSLILSNGNKAMDILYGGFVVKSGAVPAGDGTTTWVPQARKSCHITLTMSYRSGWTFALESANSRGLATLAAGTTARHTKVHTVTGAAEPLGGTRHLAGPMDGMYAHELKADPPTFGECGKSRRWDLETVMSIDSGDTVRPTMDQIAMASPHVDIGEKFHLTWREC